MIHLSSFEAVHYRGIDGLSLPKLNHVNLITGANGVGKTALVEAIWLFMGRHNPQLLWNANVQRSTNPIANPISDLSERASKTLWDRRRRTEHEWKATFEEIEEVTWETVAASDAMYKLEQRPVVGRLRTWIDNKEIDGKSQQGITPRKG